jgi:hypothetical protein
MHSNKQTDQQPFWVDEEATPAFPPESIRSFILVIRILINITIWLILAGFLLIIWLSISKLLGLILTVTLLAAIAQGLILYHRRKNMTDETADIQEQAREMTGAELMGSAVHVAGDPNLEPNQPVVLALIKNNLVIYPYASAVILDQINIHHIEKIQTVVYDEDRIPHVDVIDPTAQALQLEIITQGKSWRCLFSRMRQVRAIDWYHAIQKVKVREN